MSQNEEVKEYLNKMMHALKNAEFRFLGYNFVKKNRIDDLFCCLFATLPKKYNDILKNKIERNKYHSMLNLSRLKDNVMRPFIFSKEHYVFEQNTVLVLVQNILRTLDKDIEKVEKL